MESTRVIMADYIENNNTPNYVSPSSEIVNSTPEPVPTPVPTPVKENVFKGILGAFIGAFAGALIIFFLAQFSLWSSISGFVMGLLTVLLYSSFAGAFTKKSVAVCIAVMMITVFFTDWFSDAYILYKEVAEEYTVTLGDVFRAFFGFVKETGQTEIFIANLLGTYFFTGIGAFSVMRKHYRKYNW